MRKRIRKKKHLGEFAEFGRQFVIRRNRKEDFDEFFDWVIGEVIEGNDCFCGGTGKEDQIDIIVELGTRDRNPGKKKERIEEMLREHQDVAEVLVGEEFDLWHGDYQDLLDPRKSDSGEAQGV